MQQDNKRHVPDWLLERLALGELDAETAADVRRRLAAEGRSPDDIAAAVAASNREILDQLPATPTAAAIRQRAAKAAAAARPARRRTVMWGLPLALAGGLALTHMMLRPARRRRRRVACRRQPRDHHREGQSRAAPLRLPPRRQRQSASEGRRDRAARGDLVQLAYGGAAATASCCRSTAPRKVTLHWPERNDGDAPAVKAGENRLPVGVRAGRCARRSSASSWCSAKTPFSVATAHGGRARARGSAVGAQPIAGAAARFRTDLARARQDARRQEGAAMTTRNPLPALVAALFLLFLVGVAAGGHRQRRRRRDRARAARRRCACAASCCSRASTTAARRGRSCATRPATRARWAACCRRWAASRPRTSCSCRPPTAPRSTPRSRTSSSGCAPARTPGVRRELLVYYSGHSDEDGLMVGRDRVGYDELRARVQRAPAELRVVILDSCASGAFTRRKGGVKRAPFLMDASTDMRGHAFLTSSAADERAQESDRISASYFTYYLVSGLRGAADVNQDQRVTLQEAYQFASQETLARTERSQAGPAARRLRVRPGGHRRHGRHRRARHAVGPGADARARRPHHRARGERRAGRRAAQARGQHDRARASSRAPTSSRWTAAARSSRRTSR